MGKRLIALVMCFCMLATVVSAGGDSFPYYFGEPDYDYYPDYASIRVYAAMEAPDFYYNNESRRRGNLQQQACRGCPDARQRNTGGTALRGG